MTTTIDPTELERLHQQHAHEGVNAVASAFARHIRSRFDQQANDAMQRGLEQLIEDKLIDRVAKEGDRVPDFELPNGGGTSVRFSAILRDGRVVLVFYRGAWCPYFLGAFFLTIFFFTTFFLGNFFASFFFSASFRAFLAA